MDAILKDGLLDVYNQIDMGDCAEIIAEKYGITREEQVFFCRVINFFHKNVSRDNMIDFC